VRCADPDGFGGEVATAFGVGRDGLLAGLPGWSGIVSGRPAEPDEVAESAAFQPSGRVELFAGGADNGEAVRCCTRTVGGTGWGACGSDCWVG
jgi:hypothetical protein